MGIKTYKGTDKDMRCRGYQFAIGKTFEDDGAIRCGNKGFHSCEAPLDVFRYYPPATSRYFECEADGEIDRTGAEDSKVASSKLTLKGEIGIPGLVKAQVEWVRAKIANSKNSTGGDGANIAGGDGANIVGGDLANIVGGYGANIVGGDLANIVGGYGANIVGGYGAELVGGDLATIAGGNGAELVGGDGANIAGGDRATIVGGYGANIVGGDGAELVGGDLATIAGGNGAELVGGDGANIVGGDGANIVGGDRANIVSRGTARTGKNGLAVVRGTGVKAKGGIGSVLVIAIEQDNSFDINEWKAVVVDGETIKADTWYTLKNGEFVEVPDDAD